MTTADRNGQALAAFAGQLGLSGEAPHGAQQLSCWLGTGDT
jgi:hypothetical protein